MFNFKKLNKVSESVLLYFVENNIGNEASRVYFRVSNTGILDMSYWKAREIVFGLVEDGYFKDLNKFVDGGCCFSLTSKALTYKEQLHLDTVEYFKKLAISKLSDVVVSALVAFGTTVITLIFAA